MKTKLLLLSILGLLVSSCATQSTIPTIYQGYGVGVRDKDNPDILYSPTTGRPMQGALDWQPGQVIYDPTSPGRVLRVPSL